GPDADHLLLRVGRNRRGELDDPHARNLRDEDLAADHLLCARDHELDGLREGDEEPRHPEIGDRQRAGLPLLQEQRDHAAATADDVAVADAREADRIGGRVRVALDEDLLAAQLRRAVEVDRVHRLVGAEGDRARNARVERGVDDVLRSMHVRLYRFERVVLARVDLLHRRGVNDQVAAVGCAAQTSEVADVADEVADVVVLAKRRAELALLQLVPAEDPYCFRVPFKDARQERLAERSRSAREENRGLFPEEGWQCCHRDEAAVAGAATLAERPRGSKPRPLLPSLRGPAPVQRQMIEMSAEPEPVPWHRRLFVNTVINGASMVLA